jgi:DNA ligase 1
MHNKTKTNNLSKPLDDSKEIVTFLKKKQTRNESSITNYSKINPAVRSSKRTKERKNYNLEKILNDEENSQSNDKFLSPMLASTYDGSQDIKGWYMSEKLDGIRCIWNGSCIFSRNGNKFYPPKYFIENFPKNLWLDGELFLDRNNFQQTVSIVKRQDENDGWKKIKFLVFDGPKLKGNFKKRLEILEKELKDCSSKFLELHKQEVCKDVEHLEKKMKEIVSLKGEGVILRDPNSFYENRRSHNMLKVKEFHDAEAIVTSIHKGTGRLQNMMGAIECINKDGITFRIGTGFSDKERANPPKIGSVVTYRYFELTRDNVPRFPSFMRVHPGL